MRDAIRGHPAEAHTATGGLFLQDSRPLLVPSATNRPPNHTSSRPFTAGATAQSHLTLPTW
jgi:hypothetical protein